MTKMKTFPAVLSLLIVAAACTGTPQPAPDPANPPGAPSDTPAATEESRSGYPVETLPTELSYPLPEFPTPDVGYPAPGEALPEPSGGGYPAPGEGECALESPEPQRHELAASDGVGLVGTFYPAADCSAPLIVLYHQFGSDKESWTDLALWLQNRLDETAAAGGVLAAPAGQYSWFPPLPADLSFAVFAVDFRDHGESEAVNGDLQVSGLLLDAQAAFDYAQSLPNVDPARIITIGASIGADASVDVCLSLDDMQIDDEQVDEGCIGAMALSPGSFLEVPYVEVVTRLGEAPFDVNIRCIAAEMDANAPDLCQADIPGKHLGIVYAGRDEHGMALLAEGFDPDIGQVIYDFLLETLGIEG
jgi:hypothetical protein